MTLRTRCAFCGKMYMTKDDKYAEMFLVLYDKSPDRILSKHQGIPLCEDCHTDTLLKAGYVT